MTQELSIDNVPDLWRDKLPVPQPEGHKYDRGHLLVYGGPVMTGASRLAARAAQRMGAGLVTLGVPDKALAIYAAALESVIVQPMHDLESWQKLVKNDRINGYLLGPGMGVDPHADERVWLALETGRPTVLDADALNAFIPMLDVLLEHTHEQTVLTPHEGEFNRLFGQVAGEQPDRMDKVRRAAEIAGCTIVLKGHETIIVAPDGHAVVNRNAPPWLATAGAGDVLAGMIAGLLVQKMPVFAAAEAAVWLHGAIATQFGLGLIAEDLVVGIPAALQQLISGKI